MLMWEVMILSTWSRAKEKINHVLHDLFVDEEGDTNFISIIVILVIVLAIAAIFRKNIVSMVNAMWQSISGSFGEATGTGFNATEMK